MTKYNIYCDESCHLEHDNEQVMVIGGIKCEISCRKKVINKIYELKSKHGIPKYAEIKWNKVSPCNVTYFKSLIELFFKSSELSFRAIIVNKNEINNNEYNQTHEEFYYKMYYTMLSGIISTADENYIYVDKMNTKSTAKIGMLKYFLQQKMHDFDDSRIIRIQAVNSKELPILQLADLIIGAIGYCNRDNCTNSEAKKELVEYIKEKSGYSLKKSTFPSEQKFNLFFISLKKRGLF